VNHWEVCGQLRGAARAACCPYSSHTGRVVCSPPRRRAGVPGVPRAAKSAENLAPNAQFSPV
jgi:hypothetical protein